MDRDFYLKLLMIFTYAFIIGVAFGVFYPVSPAQQTVFWSAVVLLSLAAVIALWYQKNRSLSPDAAFYARVAFYCLLVAVAFATGWGRYSLGLGHLYPDHVSEYLSSGFEDKRVVEGRVVEAPEIYDDKVRLRLSPTRMWLSPDMEKEVPVEGGDIQLQLREYYETGVDYEYFANNDVYGDVLRITGSVNPPPGRGNPRGFSYKTYLNNHGIYGNIWYSENIQVLERSPGNRFVNWALQLQEEMLKVIKFTMPYPQSAFLGGATLGLRHGLSYTLCPFSGCERRIEREFRGAGTMHVLAVSGLHVGVIAAAFWALFAGLRVPPKLYVPLIIVCLVIFTIITGARPATVRAAIMTSLMLLTFAYMEQGLRNSVLVGVSVAALLILLYHPRYVFEASFTLSFAAVLCLALISGAADRVLQKLSGLSFIVFWLMAGISVYMLVNHWNFILSWQVYLPYIAVWAMIFQYARQVDQRRIVAGGIGFLDIPGPLRNFIGMQFAIQLGMMWPLSAYYFQEYPFAGIFANFFAIPLVSVVVPLGLFAGLLGLIPAIGPWIALVLNAGNYLAVTLFLWISHAAMNIFPYPAVRKFTPWHLLVFYSSLAVFIWWDKVYDYLKEAWFWISERFFSTATVRPKTAVTVFLGFAALAAFVASFFFYPPVDSFQATFLDVGFGEAVAVQTPGGSNLLFNAGSRKWDWHHREGLAERFNQGRRTVAPFFLSQGIKTLDLMALQSIQPQRSGGMAYVTQHFDIDRALGPLPRDVFAPSGKELTKGRFVASLQDEYYSKNAGRKWFRNDYYGNWKRWWEQLQKRGIEYERPYRGQKVYSESTNGVDFEVYVLNPPEYPEFENNGADNRSLVFRIEYGEISMLLPGDIRAEAQKQVMNLSPKFVDADVMAVPGNGIRESSFNPDFISAVNPEYVILSSSGSIDLQRTKWGSMVKKFEGMVETTKSSYSARLPAERFFYTGDDNAVVVKSDGSSVRVSGFGRDSKSAEAGTGDVTETGW